MRKRLTVANLICAGVGIFPGIMPGAGGTVAAFMDYSGARRFSRYPEEFGKCSQEGVSAPECANNADAGVFFFSSRSRHTRFDCDWSSDVCSSDLSSASQVARRVSILPDKVYITYTFGVKPGSFVHARPHAGRVPEREAIFATGECETEGEDRKSVV